MRQLYAFLLASAVCGAANAQSYQPDFDPSKLKGPAKGPANEVMMLGSPFFQTYVKLLEPT